MLWRESPGIWEGVKTGVRGSGRLRYMHVAYIIGRFANTPHFSQYRLLFKAKCLSIHLNLFSIPQERLQLFFRYVLHISW